MLAAFIFAVENAVMFLFFSLGALRDLNWQTKGLIDSLALVIGVSPALYLHLFRPLGSQIEERETAEKRFTTVLNSSPIGMYVVQSGKFQFVNPQFQQDTGYTEDELLGRDAYSLVLPEYRKMVREEAIRMLKAERSTPFEYRVATKRGEARWIMETVASLQFRGKRAALGNFMDVTERKRVEEALHESLERTAHNRQLLLALSKAAQAIQRSVTLKDIYRNTLNEVTNAGYQASLYALNDQGDRLLIQATTFQRAVLRELEDLTGMPPGNFHVPVVPGTFIHKIVSEGEPIILDPFLQAVAEVLPVSLHPLGDKVASLLGISTGVGARLTVDGKPYGMLTITGSGLTDEDVPAVSAFANQISIAIEKTELFQRVQEMAMTDGLTGLYNYRRFHELLAMEVKRARRYKRPVTLVMMDIDHFKVVNDTYGHQSGDEVLKLLAGVLRASVRETDFVARYGGEEFVILLPETPGEAACGMAERIRKTVDGYEFMVQGHGVTLTLSLGVAWCLPKEGVTAPEMVRRADQALYQAKRQGRNLVCAYPISGGQTQGPGFSVQGAGPAGPPLDPEPSR